jgi:hypothetical protein
MYVVYKVKNKLNDKVYIGVHKTKNINDSYLGSGVLIKKAVEKYGKECFEKDILHICETRNEAYSLERSYVDDQFIVNQKTYNLRLGGMGGSAKNRKFSENHRKKLSESAKARAEKKDMWVYNDEKKKEIGKKISESKKGIFHNDRNHLSEIQKNRKLATNIETGERTWVDKDTQLQLPLLESKLYSAIVQYNSGKKVIIGKKKLRSICEQNNISHLLED